MTASVSPAPQPAIEIAKAPGLSFPRLKSTTGVRFIQIKGKFIVSRYAQNFGQSECKEVSKFVNT